MDKKTRNREILATGNPKNNQLIFQFTKDNNLIRSETTCTFEESQPAKRRRLQ